MARKKSEVTYEELPQTGGYIEPENYIPKKWRKKYGLGEYAKKQPDAKKDSNGEEK